MTETPKGPASDVPSIEARYGQPVAHRLSLIAGMDGTHMVRLRAEHGLGYGHVNALVAHALGPRKDA